jgi:hypothetical protein
MACFALVTAVFASTGKVADLSHDDLKATIAAGNLTRIDVNGTDSYRVWAYARRHRF